MSMFGTVRESGSGGVPKGIYTALFVGVDPVPANVEKGYKPGFRFNFRVQGGEHANAIASRIPGGESPTTKNGLGKFLADLTGQPLAPGVDYEVEPLIGKPFQIVVKDGPQGGTRVETVIPVK